MQDLIVSLELNFKDAGSLCVKDAVQRISAERESAERESAERESAERESLWR